MNIEDIIQLLREFVDQNSNIIGLQWDPRLPPRLLINPYSEDYEERIKIAHYFLLVASVDEGRVIGRAENARVLLVHLHEKFGNDLFKEVEPKELENGVIACKIYDEFGPLKERIPSILASVNRFVMRVAKGDLVKHSKKFGKPRDVVEEIYRHVERMGRPFARGTRAKAWMYMRWMVRPKPDLRIFDYFSPGDLFIPMTTDIARVVVSLGLINKVWPLRWKDVEKVTEFARMLFPEDPAKIDYPFFMIGRWLRGRDLNMQNLKDSLIRFADFYEKTGFSILLTKEKVGYSAECPALPGCITQGETEEEVLKNMEEAIHSYLECAKDYKIGV